MKKALDQLVIGLTSADNQKLNVPITGLTTHSDHVQSGDLYIAIQGTLTDGHEYISAAIENGAVAIITNGRDVGELSVPQIKVANPRRAASIIAAEFFDHPSQDLNVIGITGTNGKTTIASLITAILIRAGFKTAQHGTLGLIAEGYPQIKTLTTLDPVSLHKTIYELKNDNFTHLVMEVSSHALQQYRVADVDFDLAVFTNLTPEHLDYHKTMDEYYHAKARLFKTLPITSTAIVNTDDDYGHKIKTESTAPVITVSFTSEEDIHFASINSSLKGVAGVIQAGEHTYLIESTLIGTFNLENILLSVATAHAMGIHADAIRTGIKDCKTIPGRMERFTAISGGTIIMDYAHTPDAYYKVLKTIRDITPEDGIITVVFGAGGDRDPTKRPKMASIVETFADRCYVTPDNPRFEDITEINSNIVEGFSTDCYTLFDYRSEALRKALSELGTQDIVVVLGKGRENYQDIRGQRVAYSDFEIIKEFCRAD